MEEEDWLLPSTRVQWPVCALFLMWCCGWGHPKCLACVGLWPPGCLLACGELYTRPRTRLGWVGDVGEGGSFPSGDVDRAAAPCCLGG